MMPGKVDARLCRAKRVFKSGQHGPESEIRAADADYDHVVKALHGIGDACGKAIPFHRRGQIQPAQELRPWSCTLFEGFHRRLTVFQGI